MKNQVNMVQVDGKLVKEIRSSLNPRCDQVVINFHDDTFACFGIRWFDGEGVIQEQLLQAEYFGDSALVSMEIASQDELDMLRKERETAKDCRKFFEKMEADDE